MSESRQNGFGNTPQKQFSKSKKTHIPAAQTAKEKKALQLINQGKLNEAKLIYRELVAVGSASHVVHGNLGALLKMEGDTQNAITCFKNALQLNPNYPNAHYNLGIAFKEQGDIEAAIACYNSVLQLKPNYPDAHYNLGNAFKEQGDLAAAIISYNKALQLKPNYPEAHNNLGSALQEQGDIEDAIACYNSALQLKPNYPEAHYNLGTALQKQGDIEAAIACYNSVLQLKPNYPGALQANLSVIEDARGLDDLKVKVRRAACFDQNILNNPQYVELIASLGGKFMRDILSSKLSAY